MQVLFALSITPGEPEDDPFSDPVQFYNYDHALLVTFEYLIGGGAGAPQVYGQSRQPQVRRTHMRTRMRTTHVV